MNKIIHPSGFWNQPFRIKSNDFQKIRCLSSTTSKIKNQQFQIKSIEIKSSLQKLIKNESFVYRSFFGELDSDYLRYPTLVSSDEENQLLHEQYEYVRENFVNLLNDEEFLKNSGFFDLVSLSETEKAYLYEAIGSSILYKSTNDKNETNSRKLITLNDKLMLTNSYLVCYEEKKKFAHTILPLIIRNSCVLNTLQSSSNELIKNDLLPNFKNHRIAFAFDEPNDNFITVPYPYWDSTASFDSETNIWTLNGQKSRIPAEEYDHFLIYCKIKNQKSSADFGIGSFLVPKDKVHIEKDGSDNYGNGFLKISFKDLNLSKENAEILVDPQATTLLNIRSTGQLLSSAVLLGIMKQLLTNMVQVADSIVPYRKLVENHLTNCTEMIYALESMLYLTSSHLDTFELDKIDLHLQAMVVKIFAAEYSERMMNVARFLFDSKHASSIISNDINNVLNVLNGCFGSTTSTRMLLGTYGLKNIGKWRFDHVVKIRLNKIYPIHFYKFMTPWYRKKFNLRFSEAHDDYKLLSRLNPSLSESADLLRKVLETETVIGSHLLHLYGKECVKYQIDLNRFCTIVMNSFQMVATISRTNDCLNKNMSNTSSTGQRQQQQELLLCKNICKNSSDQVDKMRQLVVGVLDTAEETRSRPIHTANIRFDGYFPKPTFDRVI